MNGVHDVGGMHGFGEVERAPGPPRLERWEAAVVAIQSALAGAGIRNIDEFRHSIERMDPQDYLNTTYFEHWLDGELRTLIEKGMVTATEFERRAAFFEAHETAAITDAFSGLEVFAPRPAMRGVVRPTMARPRFAVGDRVGTRVMAPRGHTRLPRYVRGKDGVIERHHGCHVFPDTNAHGLGENPHHVYSVRFEAAELWGSDAGSREAVYIDLWEPYLREPWRRTYEEGPHGEVSSGG